MKLTLGTFFFFFGGAGIGYSLGIISDELLSVADHIILLTWSSVYAILGLIYNKRC